MTEALPCRQPQAGALPVTRARALPRRCPGALPSAVLLLTSLAVACASSPPAGKVNNDQPAVTGTTVSGNYLAARHARVEGDEADAAAFLLAALENAPDDPVLLSRTYVVLTLDGRVAEAVDVARRLLAIDNDAVLAHVIVAVGDLRAGHFTAAAERLRGVSSGPLSTLLVPTLLAWSEFGAGNQAAAMAALKPLKSNNSLALLDYIHAAWLADAGGDTDAALKNIEAALKEQPEPWLRLTELAGEIYERDGRTADARALYSRYLDQHPDSQLLASTLARMETGQKPQQDIVTAQDGAAEALFDAAGIAGRQNNREVALALGRLGLFLRPDFPALQVLVADMLDQSDRYEDAIGLYQSIDPDDPLGPTAQIGVARDLDQLERFDEAEAMLRRIAAERPSDPEPLSELGDMLRRREKFKEAAAVYDEAIARVQPLQPRHWRLLYARGIALERSKQWPRAEADFLKALQFEPEQPYVLNYLGYSWVEQGRNLDQAEQMIRKAVELRPNDGYIADSLGWVLYRLGRPEEAVAVMERAVELQPEDPVINDHLGDVYWAVGRQREARFQWQAALESNPDPELKEAIRRKLAEGMVREASAAAQ